MIELLHAVPIPILLVDDNFSIVFANSVVATIAENAEKLAGSPLSSLFSQPEEARLLEGMIQKALKETKALTREGVLQTRWRMLWARVHVRPVNLGKRQLAMVTVAPQKDISNQLINRRYKKLLSIFPVGIAELALSAPVPLDLPDEQLLTAVLRANVTSGNDEFARMHGKGDFNQLIGWPLIRFSHLAQDNRDLYLQWLRKFFPTGSFEIQDVAGNGSLRYYELTLIGEVHNGRITAYWELRRDITNNKLSEQQLRSSFMRLKRTLQATVDAMAAVVEKRDPYTAGHQRRVARLAHAIAEEMGLPEDHCAGIHVAASIHDIGKIYVPAEFLSKPGTLSDGEKVIIANHPNVGYDILKDLEFPWPVAEILLQHHERLDGSGYPVGLTGDRIRLEAKIIAVADVVEAMSSHRPYRPSLGLESALTEITENKGALYDEDVVDACLAVLDRGFSFV